ncbi:cytosine-specific methyltransferase [Nonomuraea cavernae]|uniref:DNA (cytosine-5-)-methyltransferase n=2 Tax=Nonomuraea cavernae TaxID=2045107 RepID=A0A917YTD5_9ACTN|nr:cytosine-specific methyltransferase [Nonomuraea cavernae]
MSRSSLTPLRSMEICAGGGGQALGLERAGFEHALLIERNPAACATLRTNRPSWHVLEEDLREFRPEASSDLWELDLLAGGVPCTPFTIAGLQRGDQDDRDLFPEVTRLAEALLPRAIMIENVANLLQREFEVVHERVRKELDRLGYRVEWKLLDAQNFGVPQRRVRSILVALRPENHKHFQWPIGFSKGQTVGQVLLDSMASRGWPQADEWAAGANEIAPTVVGGSERRGGGDLGPTRTKRIWRRLGVNGNSIGNEVPGPDFVMRDGVGQNGWEGLPMLTVPQVALLQGFPPEWEFIGRKTARYRQVGNAFPPPVAAAVAEQIAAALRAAS